MNKNADTTDSTLATMTQYYDVKKTVVEKSKTEALQVVEYSVVLETDPSLPQDKKAIFTRNTVKGSLGLSAHVADDSYKPFSLSEYPIVIQKHETVGVPGKDDYVPSRRISVLGM